MGETILPALGCNVDRGPWRSTLGPLSGLLMQGVLWTTVIGGSIASALFTWPTDPFSVIGSGDGAVATAFNLGLVGTGLLALPFGRWRWISGRRLQGLLVGLVGAGFVLGGVFPMPSPLHEAAAGIFVGVWLLCWAAAVEDWRRENRRTGAFQFALGIAAVGIWVPYDFGIEGAMVGYAAAESVVFVAFSAWTVLTVFHGDGHDSDRAEKT